MRRGVLTRFLSSGTKRVPGEMSGYGRQNYKDQARRKRITGGEASAIIRVLTYLTITAPRFYWLESAKGAECDSLGQRPRAATVSTPGALQARHSEPTWFQANAARIISRLQRWRVGRQLPWGVAPGCCIPRLWRSQASKTLRSDESTILLPCVYHCLAALLYPRRTIAALDVPALPALF